MYTRHRERWNIDSTDNHKLRNIFSKIKCSSKTSLRLARRAVNTLVLPVLPKFILFLSELIQIWFLNQLRFKFRHFWIWIDSDSNMMFFWINSWTNSNFNRFKFKSANTIADKGENSHSCISRQTFFKASLKIRKNGQLTPPSTTVEASVKMISLRICKVNHSVNKIGTHRLYGYIQMRNYTIFPLSIYYTQLLVLPRLLCRHRMPPDDSPLCIALCRRRWTSSGFIFQ